MQDRQYSTQQIEAVALTEILDDVFMLEVLEQLNLTLKGTEHDALSFVVRSRAGRKLNLLHSHEQAGRGVHAKVDFAERASTDEGTLDPFDGSFWETHISPLALALYRLCLPP